MLTRGQFLKAAGGGAAGLLVASGRVAAAPASAASASTQTFHSRPDLQPPSLRLHYPAGATPPSASEGYLFVAPTSARAAQAGTLIVDANGVPVWFRPVPPGWWVSNFQVAQYRGEPVLAWWQGVVRPPGYGRGYGVLLNSSYQKIATVHARRGQQADLHEFQLTPEGTALITCHPATVQADLSAVGGPSDGQVLESIIQEVDVASGRLLFEWRSLEHVAIEESYLPPASPYDYLHANSIGLTPDGHLLISGRHTCALYKIHRRTGRVLWRLGGRQSYFAIGRGARFHWQHDARHLPDGFITVFDNGAGPVKSEAQSRGLVLKLDLATNSVHLVHAYAHHPKPVLTSAMGSVQVLPDANVMICYGLDPGLAEYAPDGQLLAQLWLPWHYNCYRGYRMPWSGTPADRPVIASRPASTGTTTIYASWNGATAVASWQLSAGPSPSQLQPVGVTPRSGFETAIAFAGSSGYVAVTALDANGSSLGSSSALNL